MFDKKFVLPSGGFQGDPFDHLESGGTQTGIAASLDAGIGVAHGHHHPANAGRKDLFRAGRGLAGMIAGLQGDIEGCPTGLVSSLVKGVDLGVRPPEAFMVAASHHLAVFDDHRAHQGVGRGMPRPPCGQIQGHIHIILVAYR